MDKTSCHNTMLTCTGAETLTERFTLYTCHQQEVAPPTAFEGEIIRLAECLLFKGTEAINWEEGLRSGGMDTSHLFLPVQPVCALVISPCTITAFVVIEQGYLWVKLL